MTKPKALFLGTEEGISNAYSTEVKSKLGESLDFVSGCYDKHSILNGNFPADEFKKVDYIFSTWGMVCLDEEQIGEIFPNLKGIFYAAGTVQEFAQPFLNRGVKIFSAWGANAVPVAEVTVSQIILSNKGFFQTMHNGKSNLWHEHDSGKPYPGSYDTNVGIIGAGMIGTLVIGMLKAYRLNVLVFDPFMSDEKAEKLGVEKVSTIPELFEKCQVVSNHLANNPQTVGMIDKSCFDKMKPNGTFLNTGRGKQVVEAELISALKAEPTRAAVLDVTWPEPPMPESELYTLPNVFLTPHLAGSIGNEIQRMGEYMLDEFTALSEGRETKYQVTEEMLKTMA